MICDSSPRQTGHSSRTGRVAGHSARRLAEDLPDLVRRVVDLDVGGQHTPDINIKIAKSRA